MYSIPLFLLNNENNILTRADIQNHQNFCKLFFKAQSTFESKLEESKSKKTQKKDKDLPSKVWSWFDNLPFEQKLKICTIKNKWVLKILIQLYFIHLMGNKTTFEPSYDMKVLFTTYPNYPLLYFNSNNKDKKKYMGYNEDDYYDLYFTMNKAEFNMRKKNNTTNEENEYRNKLLNSIIFLSLEDEDILDSVSLNEDLLKDTKTLKQIMNFFSNKECFKEWLTPINYYNYNNFCYPLWMHNKKELSLCQIITGFFEQQILVAYEYFFYSKKIYFFPKIELILNMIKENENLENFFMNKNKNKSKENIITLELINEMISNFKSNITFKKRFDDYKKMFDQLYKEYYKTEFYIGDPVLENQGEDIYKELIEEMNTNKIKGKEMHLLLNKITFMKLKDINNYREFIYFNLKKYFTEIRNKEFLEDLLNDTNDNKEGKKKKKKKKKNKNNSSNNNININININNIEENKIIDNENNNIEKNFSSNDENDTNSNINSGSSNSLKIKENKVNMEKKDNKENIIKKEEKIKKKEFFLFPTNKKKNKNKIKNNEIISDDKSQSEKNNIKINYIDKKEEKAFKIENENKIINNKSKSKTDLQQLSESSTIRLEMLNTHNKSIEDKKQQNNQNFINSPESTTSFSFEVSSKDKLTITKDTSIQNKNNKENNFQEDTNNINENKNQINMTINIINNQYIYQQYPLFNFNFDNFAFMQSQFFYYYQVPSEHFFDNLTREIKLYEEFTTNNIKILDIIRRKYFIKVEKMIESGLKEKYEIKFGHYGSFFTNLSIEGSDVDIRVYYKPLLPNLDFLEDIIDLLNEHKNEFESINPRLSASVPVIVLQININQEIDNKILKYSPYFENKDISHINIDLTFTSDKEEFKRPGQIVNYINSSLIKYEEIRPLLLVIKRYFRVMKMNKSFTGGLSSYSLFLLILAFLKDSKLKMNLGKYLYYIMEKYAFFDYKNLGINVEGKDCYFPLDIFNNADLNSQDMNNTENFDNIYENDRIEEIKIFDPLTKLNVAKSSFKLDEIKITFNKALYFLKFESWKFQNSNFDENTDSTEDFTIIKKLFSIK